MNKLDAFPGELSKANEFWLVFEYRYKPWYGLPSGFSKQFHNLC